MGKMGSNLCPDWKGINTAPLVLEEFLRLALEEMILRENLNIMVKSGITNVVSYHECHLTGAGFYLRLTTFVVGCHKCEKELGRPITQAEAFKASHIRKKKTPGDPNVWVEPRAQLTYNRYLQFIEDFRQTLPEDRRDLPLSQEQNERIWLDVVGDSSRGIPPCPDDVVCPPRPPQSLSISHGVYDQYKDVTEDPSSDEDDEDYYVDNIPSRC
ncbi:hypothetical protein FXO37_16808 [Capsicum annuum]|nr:hypothetical protein FXO37_16808 [Capsicum annuum]